MKKLLIFFFLILKLTFSQNNNYDSIIDYNVNIMDSLALNQLSADSLNTINCFNFSHEPGLYDSIINLKASICEGELFYLKNRFEKTNKKQFTDSLIIDKSTSICFFKKTENKYEPLGCFTYLIDFKTNFHIVSLTINQNDFFSEKYGIYAKGENAVWDTIEKRHVNANFARKWEKKLNVEVFSPEGDQIINQNAGVKIFGGMTKYGKEKSLRLIAREIYGTKKFNADLFGKGKTKYKQFILRHSGNDHNNTRFKDAFITSIASEEGLDVQQSSPTHLFVNSEYWGVYNIREKINDHYIKNNYQIESEGLDIIQGMKTTEFGSNKEYNNLRSFIRKNSLKDSVNYNKVKSEIDTRNFINYWIFQMFIVNHDARGNIRFWRSSLIDNKFRWILYDTDLGFSSYKENMIRDFTSPVATRWYNPPWATFLLRHLLKNKKFETDFINQSLWLLSNKLTSEYLTNRIDWFEKNYENEMKIHFTRDPNKFLNDRWYHIGRVDKSFKNWQKEVNQLKFFAMKRPAYFLKNLKRKFNIETYLLNISIDGKEHGEIKINGNILEKKKFSSLFSKNHKLPIKVTPNEGYQSNFNQNFIQTQSDTIDVNITFKKIPKKYWWRED